MTKSVQLVAATFVAGMLGGSAVCQKDGVSRRPDPGDLADENVKKILFVMDTNKYGKITKEVWMKFMAAEFDRLDVNKSGTIDPKTLRLDKTSIRVTRSSELGK